eukprot:m.57846 g.57846  ORF g.57846 m.57846 type:complete len:104 (-) comp11635_c0_seq1:1337-1648(-)
MCTWTTQRVVAMHVAQQGTFESGRNTRPLNAHSSCIAVVWNKRVSREGKTNKKEEGGEKQSCGALVQMLLAHHKPRSHTATNGFRNSMDAVIARMLKATDERP